MSKNKKQVTVHRGVAMVDVEPINEPVVLQPESNRAAYLAAHPEARKVHESHMARFAAAYRGWQGNQTFAEVLAEVRANPKISLDEALAAITRSLPLRATAQSFVLKANNARELGEILIEWQETLPGRKFTRDFYEQHKREFMDEAGLIIPFEQLEWLIRVARAEKEPVDDLLTAWKCRTPMLLALGLEDAERPPGKPVIQADEVAKLQEIFDPAEIETRWNAFLSSPRYCPNGVIRDEWKEVLMHQLKPTFILMEKVKRALGV